MTKYRYQKVEEQFSLNLGPTPDYDDGEDFTLKWVLSDRPHKADKAEKLEDYVPLTPRQLEFLVNYAHCKLDFAQTRTKKEASKLIGKAIEGFKKSPSYDDLDIWFDAYGDYMEEPH